MEKKTEKRSYDLELRALNEDSRTIEGYAIVFNKESHEMCGFIEEVAPEALSGVIKRSDVLALLNHDERRGVLARCTNGKGTLELIVDEKGLLYRFEAPNTTLGDEVLEGARRKDIRTSSFCFTTLKDEWTKMPDGKYKRRILEIDKLYDVSPVYREAYPDTTVATRSLDKIKDDEESKEKERQKDELNNYYKQIEDEYTIGN